MIVTVTKRNREKRFAGSDDMALVRRVVPPGLGHAGNDEQYDSQQSKIAPQPIQSLCAADTHFALVP